MASLKREIMKKPILLSIFLWITIYVFAGYPPPRYGIASYYGKKENHRRTACGEKLCNDSFTAAYKIYPFGTYLKVTNMKNDRIAIVRINDRRPHRKRRIIDLSYAAAKKIKLMNCGIVQVKVELATVEEIKNKDKLNTDSLATDSAACVEPLKTLKDVHSTEKIFMIQAGIFRLKNSAFNLEKYLNHKSVPGVSVLKLNFKGHECYKVTIEPLDTNEKEIALKYLRARHIKGMVSRKRLNTHKHKRRSGNE